MNWTAKTSFRTKNVNIAGIGNRTTLSLRPERVIIEPAPGSMPNIFNARVEELIYLGDHIRTRLKVCGHDDFVVKVANSSARAALNKGERLKSVGILRTAEPWTHPDNIFDVESAFV